MKVNKCKKKLRKNVYKFSSEKEFFYKLAIFYKLWTYSMNLIKIKKNIQEHV